VFFSDPDGNRWAVQQLPARGWYRLRDEYGGQTR
jgi:hypothetical protein